MVKDVSTLNVEDNHGLSMSDGRGVFAIVGGVDFETFGGDHA